MGRRRNISGSAQPSSTAPATVPINSITHNPRNPRDDYDDIADLAESIREVGVLQPLGIVRYEVFLSHYPNHEHDIGAYDWVALNGNRRLAAAREAGIEEVPVHVLDKLGREAHLDESVLVENIHREALPPLREAQAIQILLERHGSQREVARRISVSQGYVSQRLSLLKLTPELQETLNTGKMTVEDARRLAKLPTTKQQAEWTHKQEGDYDVITPTATDPADYDVINTKSQPHQQTENHPTVKVDNPQQVAKELRHHFNPQQLKEIAKLLTE